MGKRMAYSTSVAETTSYLYKIIILSSHTTIKNLNELGVGKAFLKYRSPKQNGENKFVTFESKSYAPKDTINNAKEKKKKKKALKKKF